MLRFGEFVGHFTILVRRILSSDRLSNTVIDDFTDALKELLETMPEKLQFDKFRSEAPDWPLSVMATGTLSTFLSSIWPPFSGACARSVSECHIWMDWKCPWTAMSKDVCLECQYSCLVTTSQFPDSIAHIMQFTTAKRIRI
jgi:hypothetical protein